MRASTRIGAALLLTLGLGCVAYAADLQVVVLDSKDGHALKGKLVCIAVPPSKSDPVVYASRECRRTDSDGTATFPLSETPPETIKVELSSNGLLPCYAPKPFVLADALKDGVVAKNTCGDTATSTIEPGEVVLYAHQKNVKESLGTVRNEF